MIVKVTKRGPMAYFWMGVFRGIEAILSVLSCGAYRKLTPKTKLVAVVSTLDFLWLATGTIFYTALNGDELTFSEAIFLATNVGLGVGYGNVLPESMATIWFTVAFALVGTSLVVGSVLILAEAVMSNVMANLEEDEEEVHHAPSTTKEAVAEVLQNYYKSVMSSFRTRDGILVICWWIWTIGGVLWFKYSEGMSFMVAIYFITTSYNTSGMVDPGNSNAALITTTVFLLIGFPLNVFTWTTVMNNAFVAFKTDKLSEEIHATKSKVSRHPTASSPLIERATTRDWTTFLEEELVDSGFLTGETLDAIRERYQVHRAAALAPP